MGAGIHNAVHSDAIWRQTIRYETNTANNWENNWGFIRQAMIENELLSRKKCKGSEPVLKLPQISQDKRRTGLPSKLGLSLKDPAHPIITDWLFTSNVNGIIKYRFPSQKYFLPTTTAHEIGWPWGARDDKKDSATSSNEEVSHIQKRSMVPQAPTLEIFGKQARGQGDVLKWFGAPEALP